MHYKIIYIFQIKFVILLTILIHFRLLIPSGIIELYFLVFLIFLFIRYNNFNKEMFMYLILFGSVLSSLLMSLLLNIENNIDIKPVILVSYGLTIAFLAFNIFRMGFLVNFKFFIVCSAIIGGLTFIGLLLFYSGVSSFDNLLYIRGSYARGSGLLGGPNYYSISMFFSFLVSYYIWRKNNWGGLYVIIILLGALSSLSRGLILSLIVFFFFLLINNKHFFKKTIQSILSFSIFFLFVYILIPENTKDNLYITLESRFLDKGGGGKTRLDNITDSLELFSSNKIFFGHGRANFIEVNDSGENAHNMYVTYLIDYGIIGFSIFSFFLIFIIISRIKKKLSFAMLMSLLAISLTNDYHLTKEWWLIIALILSVNY